MVVEEHYERDDMIASPAYWRGKIEAYKEVQGFIEKVLPVIEMSLKISKGIHKEGDHGKI